MNKKTKLNDQKLNDQSDYVTLYDSTLRDGAQARGVDFTLADKQAIARALDKFGIDYIEGGWPGANPNDDAFFAEAPPLKKARLSAFGMTRRAGRSAANDPGLAALLESGARSICLVGKSWEHQVKSALGISPAENLRMIEESIALVVKRKCEALYDAEHFFDGYKANSAYALSAVKAAFDNGARWIVLCDTNGGSLPFEIEEIVSAVVKHIPGKYLGIHCHNDTDNAVANSLAAVRAGVRQVQGTINGIGERCGNANLISIIPNLLLKMGMSTGVTIDKLKQLTALSRLVDERLGRLPNQHSPYVGAAAFAHKGGLHVSAMSKDNASYEHITPEIVGNSRTILISDKAGRANILNRLAQLGIKSIADDEIINSLVAEVKAREKQGYAYEGAEASFEMLARRKLGEVFDSFQIAGYRVIGERRYNAKGALINISEATVKLIVNGEESISASEGNGPVNALDGALRKGLAKHFPKLKDIHLTDFKVRIIDSNKGTGAITRVTIESRDNKGNSWTTLGVSSNLTDAAFDALLDSYHFILDKAYKNM